MFEYKEEYSKLTNVCLNLTDACNLECRYCFVAQQPHFMSYQTAKDAVDWLIKNKRWKNEHGYPNEKAHLAYFGGEPTLLWDEIIFPLTQYAFETYPGEIDFGMTTNGTLLNEQRIKFMSTYQIVPLLSIDGAPETQNYNRPCRDRSIASFDLVAQNIPYILKYFPNTTFRGTIDEHTVSHIFENYIFAQYMGFSNIYFMPNSRNMWSEENLQILEDEFKKIYLYMINCFEQGIMPPNFSPISDSFRRIKQHNLNIVSNNKQQRNCVRCGLGTGMGSIGYNGDIFGCQEQDSQGKESHFYLGNIYNGINQEKHKTFLKEYLNVEKVICAEKPEYCDNCPLSLVCGEINCPSSSYDLYQDFGKDGYVHCRWMRAMFEQAIVVLKYLENNKTFQQYLIQYCGYDFLKEEK